MAAFNLLKKKQAVQEFLQEGFEEGSLQDLVFLLAAMGNSDVI